MEWRKGLAGCPPQGIQVSLTDRTPEDLRPKAFAFATPGEDRVRIFYDRIERVKPRLPVEIGKGMLIPHLLAQCWFMICWRMCWFMRSPTFFRASVVIPIAA